MKYYIFENYYNYKNHIMFIMVNPGISMLPDLQANALGLSYVITN